MDSTDKKILEVLQENALMTFKELAEKLSITSSPIYGRIRKLQDSGIVKQFVALLHADLLGKGFIVFMNITGKDHHSDKRNKFVAQMEKL
jgi:DNA-binding Lrp family transcriptional regulator